MVLAVAHGFLVLRPFGKLVRVVRYNKSLKCYYKQTSGTPRTTSTREKSLIFFSDFVGELDVKSIFVIGVVVVLRYLATRRSVKWPMLAFLDLLFIGHVTSAFTFVLMI